MNNSTNKNLKDTKKDSVKDNSSIPVPYLSSWRNGLRSYTKTNKLITALYMVTDVIEKEEPIRNKLRNLGAEIVSDIHLIQQDYNGQIESKNACSRISETVSFLNIASAMNFISEMNCAILKKEFLELKASIQEDIDVKPTWLADFFGTNDAFLPPLNKGRIEEGSDPHPTSPLLRGRGISKGHTSIGVQKGSTLLKAIKDMSNRMLASNENENISSGSNKNSSNTARNNFYIIKKQRRDSITIIIKNSGGSASIKDIINHINTDMQGTLSCSEKTLQRELISMTKDGVLYKTGEKRWSRYGLGSSN